MQADCRSLGRSVAALLWISAVLVTPAITNGSDIASDPHWRKPVALAVVSDQPPGHAERWLYAANSTSGSLSLVDMQDWLVRSEWSVGGQLTDLISLPGGCLLAVDQAGSQLLLLRHIGDSPMCLVRIATPRGPTRAIYAPSSQCVVVVCQWPRMLVRYDWSDLQERAEIAPVGDGVSQAKPSVELPAEVWPLPFPPGRTAVIAPNQVLIADAFGGRLAVFDTVNKTIREAAAINGHNIRGICLSPDRSQVLLTHQQLNSKLTTSFEAIHWGELMQNRISLIPVASLIEPRRVSAAKDVTIPVREIQLGATGYGAADPSEVVATSDGVVAVAISGVDGLAVFPIGRNVVQNSVSVGHRPVAVEWLPGREVFVVGNMLDDTLSVCHAKSGKSIRTVSLGPTPSVTFRERGERLFYDARLSHDSWMSCHSCHPDGHSNGLLADTVGDGTVGTAKRALSLLGTRDNNPWGWNGSARTLDQQVRKSIVSTMHGEPERETDLIAIATFLHSLQPAPPLMPRPGDSNLPDGKLWLRGEAVFQENGCATCHVPPLTFTTDSVFDVGLRDEVGLEKFNPPSLRGVSQRRVYFHDGRARTLEAVFSEFGHQLATDLSEDDLRALVRYLRSL